MLEIQTNTSNMSNTSFPPQIGNYLLGPQLGSGVSGMFDFDRRVDPGNGGELTCVGG